MNTASLTLAHKILSLSAGESFHMPTTPSDMHETMCLLVGAPVIENCYIRNGRIHFLRIISGTNAIVVELEKKGRGWELGVGCFDILSTMLSSKYYSRFDWAKQWIWGEDNLTTCYYDHASDSRFDTPEQVPEVWACQDAKMAMTCTRTTGGSYFVTVPMEDVKTLAKNGKTFPKTTSR